MQAEPNPGFCVNGGVQPALLLRWIGLRMQAEVNPGPSQMEERLRTGLVQLVSCAR
jgi:hypothetical protein